jgi:hypothetical protein
MAADGEDSLRTEVVSSGQAPPGEPPGHPDRMARPARPGSRTWWVMPYCAGALAVFVVAGLIIGLRHTSGMTQSASQPKAAVPMPAEVFPDTLFGRLTADIQAGNETAFLGMASAAARPALTTWWENLRAIGFTTGAVIPTASLDAVHIDSHGNGTTVVLAGAHSLLDPTDASGKPQIPMELYRIGLHFAGPGATGQITSWQPLGDAPWDQGSRLVVRKAAHVVVVGLPGDSALVDQTLPVAETAAAYDVGVMHNDAPGFLQQQGFVVFVSGSAAVRDRWFATNPQPQGWPPQFLGARAVQLPGPAVTADVAVGRGTVGGGQSTLVNGISDDSMGGVRVVLTPAAGTSHDQTVTLVGEFMLDILATQDENPAYGVAVKPVASWTEQGLAVAVQSMFEDNPTPLTRGRYTFATLTAKLRGLPSSYRTGQLPSTAQLFGPSLTTDEDWGYVAASAYEYIHSQYDLSRMIVSAMELYAYLGNHSTPFANVYKSGTNSSNIKFFGIHSIGLFGWRPWIARF